MPFSHHGCPAHDAQQDDEIVVVEVFPQHKHAGVGGVAAVTVTVVTMTAVGMSAVGMAVV